MDNYCQSSKPKPVVVKFQCSDGTYARFKATKIVQKPVKVTFYPRKRMWNTYENTNKRTTRQKKPTKRKRI